MPFLFGKVALDRMIDDPVQSNRNVTFFGGEPLIKFPLMRELVLHGENRAFKRGVRISFGVTTNGTLLTTEIAEFIRDHHMSVLFSLDGDAETTNRIRVFRNGLGAYDIAAQKFQMLKSVMGRDANQVLIRATYTRHNLNLLGILRHLQKLGSRRVALVPAFVANHPEFSFQEEDISRLRTAYQEIFSNFCNDVISTGYSADTQSAHWLNRVLSKSARKKGCGAGRSYLGVSVTGKYSLCHRFFDLPNFYMGTVVKGYDISQVERIVGTDVDTIQECSGCWSRYYCGRMCYHDAYMSSGSCLEPVKMQCQFMKIVVEMAIAALLNVERQGHLDLLRYYLNASGKWTDAENLYPKQVDGLMICTAGEKYVLVNKNQSHIVNKTVLEILILCDGRHRPYEISSNLVRRYNITNKEAFVDTLTCIYKLHDIGLIK